MELNHDIEERLLAYIAKELAVPRSRVDPRREIETSIGCSGDDAWELMENLSKEFEIDMSAFDFDRHFEPELPGPLFWLFFAAAALLTIPIALTVGRLVASGLKGWIETGVTLAIALPTSFLMAGWAYSRLPSERRREAGKIPVTGEHLIAAATLKRWPMCYAKSSTA